MTKKLASLLAIPLIFSMLSGCGNTPIIKNEPIPNKPIPHKRTAIAYVQSNYPQFCDCSKISTEIYEAYQDLAKLKWVEESSREEIGKDPKNLSEKDYLKTSLALKEIVTKKKEELIIEGKNCGCYEQEL